MTLTSEVRLCSGDLNREGFAVKAFKHHIDEVHQRPTAQ